MSVSLTGQYGFFTRQGAIIGEFNRVAAFYGSDLTAGFNSIWSQFATSDQAAVENLPSAVSSFQDSAASYEQTLIADGQLAMLLQTDRDTAVVPYTVQQAITIVRTQMAGAGASIQRATLGNSVTPDGSNYSDATVVISTTNQYGDPIDMTVAETITVTCTNGSTAYAEALQAVGETALSAVDPNWPGGSGANVAFNITDPSATGIITNGGFTGTWTSNTPANWTIIDGEAGVTVFREVAGGVRTAADACRLLSDGAQATQLGQNVSLAINTVYFATVQAKVSASDGSGTLVIQLTDGDGNVLQDDAGNNLTYTRNMSAQVTTSYQAFTVPFATPRFLPSTVRLEVGFGTAPTSGKSLYLDLINLVAGTPLYTNGPTIAAFSGANQTAFDDTWAIAITNTLTTQSFALGMQRLYNMRSMGVYFPSANSPTISDSLVTH